MIIQNSPKQSENLFSRLFSVSLSCGRIDILHEMFAVERIRNLIEENVSCKLFYHLSNNEKTSPICFACLEGNVDKVQQLLNDPNVDVNDHRNIPVRYSDHRKCILNRKQWGASHIAVLMSNPEILKILLSCRDSKPDPARAVRDYILHNQSSHPLSQETALMMLQEDNKEFRSLLQVFLSHDKFPDSEDYLVCSNYTTNCH